MKKILRVLLPIILAAGILWWMYREMDWTALTDALQHDMKWGWMVASLPFGILAQVLRALRWRQLLRPIGEHPRLSTSVNAVFLSYASSLVVPRVGEVLRCGILKRYDGVNFSKSLGTVVTERVVDMSLMLLLSIITFLLQIPVFVKVLESTGVSIGDFFGQFTSTGYIVTVVCGIVIVITGWLLVRRYSILTRTRSVGQELLQGLMSVRHVDGIGLFILYSVGIWLSYYLHFYITFLCFDATAGLDASAGLVAFVIGTYAVLVPTPNGAGPWHFAVKTVLMLYGVPGTIGAMFVLIVHTVQTALVAALGPLALAALAVSGHKNND